MATPIRLMAITMSLAAATACGSGRVDESTSIDGCYVLNGKPVAEISGNRLLLRSDQSPSISIERYSNDNGSFVKFSKAIAVSAMAGESILTVVGDDPMHTFLRLRNEKVIIPIPVQGDNYAVSELTLANSEKC